MADRAFWGAKFTITFTFSGLRIDPDARVLDAGAGIGLMQWWLAGRGVEVSDIWHGPPFPVEARQPGPDPERTSYGSFFYLNDPDGNTWLVQEVTTRLPGRI